MPNFLSRKWSNSSDRIGLAAVHARVLPQKGNQVLDPFGDGRLPALLGRVDISLAVRRVVLLLVGGPARAAVVVPLAPGFPPPSEFIDVLFMAAAPASPHISRL
jgi:hypothetical protein